MFPSLSKTVYYNLEYESDRANVPRGATRFPKRLEHTLSSDGNVTLSGVMLTHEILAAGNNGCSYPVILYRIVSFPGEPREEHWMNFVCLDRVANGKVSFAQFGTFERILLPVRDCGITWALYSCVVHC